MLFPREDLPPDSLDAERAAPWRTAAIVGVVVVALAVLVVLHLTGVVGGG